jgi:hypothetical protein
LPTEKNIRILPSEQLDKSKWDACVSSNKNGLIYSLSWVMDIMSDQWAGVVVEDYEAVMALPLKSKLGIEMISLPPFIQRLGPVGEYDPSLVRRMGEETEKFKKLIQYAASEDDLFQTATKRTRLNLILPLDDVYEKIAAKYTSPCKKNLNKATSRGCVLSEDISVGDVISLYKKAYSNLSAYTDKHFELLSKLVTAAKQRESCHLAGVYNEKGMLVYAGLLMDDGKRLYYLLGAPTEEGRQMRATYFFIDSMIRSFAGTSRLFDFEGSDIPDVASFYQSFSPEKEYYYEFYLNTLSFPLNKIVDLKFKA